jgi:copper homeostasis protein
VSVAPVGPSALAARDGGPGLDRARVELSVDTVAGAVAADALGVRRIELCSAGALGGLTPGPGLLAAVLARCRRTEVHVLVRPREGGFEYRPAEVDAMAADVAHAVAAGAAGVVLGALGRDGDPDRAAVAELIAAAGGRPVCFHRALDVCRDPLAAVDRLAGWGVHRVLSSGHAVRAEDGAGLLAAMVRVGGDRLAVTACGGIRAHNAAALLRATGVADVHAAPRRPAVREPAVREPAVREPAVGEPAVRARGGPVRAVDFGGHAELDLAAAEELVAAVRAG